MLIGDTKKHIVVKSIHSSLFLKSKIKCVPNTKSNVIRIFFFFYQIETANILGKFDRFSLNVLKILKYTIKYRQMVLYCVIRKSCMNILYSNY